MKFHQINNDDLVALEELAPELLWLLDLKLNDTAIRMKARRIKEILSNVRWSYGPPEEVEIQDATDPDDPTTRGEGWKSA